MTNEVTRDPIAVLLRLVDDFEWAVKTQRSGDADKLRKAIRTHVESMLPLPVAGIPATGGVAGWQLVPRPATVEMILAGCENRTGETPTHVYRASEVGAIFEDMCAAAPKPTEQPCYCGPGISLQSVSGGAHETGLFGTVWLRIDGESVEYVRKSASPAVVPIRASTKLTSWPLGMGLEPEKVAQAEARIRDSVALHQFGQAAEKELGHD